MAGVRSDGEHLKALMLGSLSGGAAAHRALLTWSSLGIALVALAVPSSPRTNS